VVYGDQLGGAYNDTVTLGLAASGGVQVTLNGMAAQFKPGEVNNIDVITRGGTNTVNVEATSSTVPLTVDLIGGTGTVNISSKFHTLYTIQGNVFVESSSNADVIAVFDQGEYTPYTYSITPWAVTRSGVAKIAYESYDGLNLYGSNGSSTYNIVS